MNIFKRKQFIKHRSKEQGGVSASLLVMFTVLSVLLLLAVKVYAGSPGGISAGLKFWGKADSGLYTDTGCSVAASDTDDVGCWEDQSLQMNDVTEGTGAEQPDLIDTADDVDFNFNPSLHFDGGDHITRSTMLSSGDDITVFAVFRNDSLTGTDQVVGFGTDSDDPGLESSTTTLNVRNDPSAPVTLSHGTALSTSTTYMSSFRATNGTNQGVDLRLNGDEDTDGTFDMTSIGAEFGIGANQSAAGTDSFDGEVAEIIVYSSDLSDLNIRKVESYLAVKYGINIDQTAGTSYLSSNCTSTACNGVGEVEIWDSGATDASTYDNEIAVIGQDNGSDLNQTKSRSVNSDSMVTVFAASDLEDLEFFAVGNDNGSVSTFSGEVPGSGLPANATARLTREWLAQNNGGDGVGTVSVTFDLSQQTALRNTSVVGDFALLIDTDGDFSNATVHTVGASFDGNEITFTLADIDSSGDGLYFSLAGPGQDAPGDVSANLQFWVKASTGVYTDTGCSLAASAGNDVGCWQDLSMQGNDLTEGTGTEQPDVVSTSTDADFNYNPTLNFDGGDHMTRATMLASGDDISTFIVYKQTSTSLTAVVHFDGPNTWNPLMYYSGGVMRVLRGGSIAHSVGISTDTIYSIYFRATNGINQGIDFSINGDVDSNAGFDMTVIGPEFSIGSRHGLAATFPLTGEVAEAIVYDANLSALEASQVDSYLSLKYGITRDQGAAQSYLASNCTTVACNGGGEVEMWDSGAADASVYDNDIAGIGKDSASGLKQIKSRSVNSDSMIIVEAASDLDDLEFFTWGNNNGSTSIRSSEVPSGMPANANSRLTREWLGQNNGGDGIGTVSVTFDLDDQTALDNTAVAGDYALLVDTDGNFSNATVHTTGASFNGSELTFTGADIRSAGDGLYFTLAGPGIESPGDVLSNLQLWLKSDIGVFTNTGCSSAASAGNDVGCWQDQSLQSNDVTEGTGSEQPDFVSTSDDEDFNFNTSIHFDGGDHLTRSTLLASGDDVSVFAVFRNESLTGDDTIVGFSTDAGDPGFETSGTTLNIQNDDSAPANFAHGTAITTNTTYLGSIRSTNGTNAGVDVRLNGDEDTDGTYDMVTIGAEFGIGADQASATTDAFDGEIAEVVIYDADLSDLNTRKVESYLAVKYGITIDQAAGTSYLASNCTTTACGGAGEVEMWDSGAADASTYDNDIAGLGKDDISTLSQTQSRSVNSDSIVKISTASDLEDLEFFMWGNDDGSISAQSTEVPGGLPGTATVRVTREWLAQDNGGDGVGTVTVTFDLENQFALSKDGTASDYALLIDTDGNFINATVHTTGASKSSNEVSFTLADIRSAGDGLYFSLAGPPKITPGNVSTNIELWLKADTSVYTNTGCNANASNGNDVGCWGDQIQGSNITESITGEQPDLILDSADEDFNHNPSIHFDGGDHLTRSTLLSAGDDVSVFAVFRNETLTGADQVIGFGTDSDDPGLETSGTTLNVRNDASAPATLGHGSALATSTTYLAGFRATNGATMELIYD